MRQPSAERARSARRRPIFQWVSQNVKDDGYSAKDRGALYALTNRKGDCTEFMYLFVALCRLSADSSARLGWIRLHSKHDPDAGGLSRLGGILRRHAMADRGPAAQGIYARRFAVRGDSDHRERRRPDGELCAVSIQGRRPESDHEPGGNVMKNFNYERRERARKAELSFMLFRVVHAFCGPLVLTLLLFGLGIVPAARAEDSLCATVKIEIQQELTLERQAFDAHMRINNGLTHIALENVKVDVTFADVDGNTVSATSDANNTNALFFIRIDSMENITNVDGSGTVAPSTSADIHWLIIPAPGAGSNTAQGIRYAVGAHLSYKIGGEEQEMDVTPDTILVKPMPRLTLDYFLPHDVYGDDAFTDPDRAAGAFFLGSQN